jgi:aspartate/methionine/tyrosine aminotransferase
MSLTLSTAISRIQQHSQRPGSRPGPDVLSLSSGDPDFETPSHIRRALRDAIDAGYTHYVDNRGDPELRSAIASDIQSRYDLAVDPNAVVVTHGGGGALASSMIATLNPEDKVLLPEPTYSSYADIAHMVGARPEFIPQTSDFHLDLDAIERQAVDARLLVLCHPNNPTGVVYHRGELVELARLAERFGFMVLADEAYDSLVFDGVEFVSSLQIKELMPSLIYCQTFSKRFAMTGWRLGYVIAPKEVGDAITLIHRTINGSGNAAVQRAGIAALTRSQESTELMRAEYQARRELVAELLAGAEGIDIREPDGTFYYFFKVTAPNAPDDLVKAALDEGVAIRSGSEYGPSGTGHFRITFATGRSDLEAAVLRLRRMIENWVQ